MGPFATAQSYLSIEIRTVTVGGGSGLRRRRGEGQFGQLGVVDGARGQGGLAFLGFVLRHILSCHGRRTT